MFHTIKLSIDRVFILARGRYKEVNRSFIQTHSVSRNGLPIIQSFLKRIKRPYVSSSSHICSHFSSELGAALSPHLSWWITQTCKGTHEPAQVTGTDLWSVWATG